MQKCLLFRDCWYNYISDVCVFRGLLDLSVTPASGFWFTVRVSCTHTGVDFYLENLMWWSFKRNYSNHHQRYWISLPITVCLDPMERISVMSYGEKQMGSPLCPNNPDFRRGDGSYNNLLQRSPKPLNSSLESRLSPRVKVGVELSILKSNSPMARDNKMITGGHYRGGSDLSSTHGPLPSTPSITDTESDSNGMSNSNYDQRKVSI